MQAYIVSDWGPGAQAVRPAVLRAGFDSPPGNTVTPDLAAVLVPKDAGLVVLLLSPAPERAMEALGQVRAVVSCPVLVVGPAGDSRLVLRALRAGAADFIDERDPEGELPAAIGRLRGGVLARLPEPARTIAVMAPSGGCGASTVAANVATALAAKRQATLLLDLNLRGGDLASLLDLRPAHTLAELCQVGPNLDRMMLESCVVQHDSGVRLLAPPRWFSDAQHVTPDGVQRVLTIARGTFPYVVMDVERTFAPEQVAALRMADVIALVLRLDFTCVRQARRTLDYLSELGIGRDRVRVVANRYGQYKEVPSKKAEEALGVAISDYIPEDPKTVNRANNNGVPVVQESPSARVSKSLRTLAAGVNGRKHS